MNLLDCQVTVNEYIGPVGPLTTTSYSFSTQRDRFAVREVVRRVVQPWNHYDASQGEGWIIVRLLFRDS